MKKFKQEYTIKIKTNTEKDCQEALVLIKNLLPKFSDFLEWERPGKFYLTVKPKKPVGKGKGVIYSNPVPSGDKQ